MHESYDDILERISEPPTWFDENGTPRYGEFHPDRCPNIYSHHVGLFLIGCQDCDAKFHVQMSANIWSRELSHPPMKWHYGDPPRHDCPGAGESMNCEDYAVLQFWTKENFGEWERRPEFEGVIDDVAANTASTRLGAGAAHEDQNDVAPSG